ncbi:collagen alpha-1(I) chain-like [Phacochoerus africanus]|uniref:collagen alpha-1(I) chain-like n=1 Tax=Phacochoerus africanus TaxID=41426 RepID=UPI001FDA7EBB|nr:collagen alpha-1(I) chain-like [Phacochoerus africanus]
MTCHFGFYTGASYLSCTCHSINTVCAPSPFTVCPGVSPGPVEEELAPISLAGVDLAQWVGCPDTACLVAGEEEHKDQAVPRGRELRPFRSGSGPGKCWESSGVAWRLSEEVSGLMSRPGACRWPHWLASRAVPGPRSETPGLTQRRPLPGSSATPLPGRAGIGGAGQPQVRGCGERRWRRGRGTEGSAALEGLNAGGGGLLVAGVGGGSQPRRPPAPPLPPPPPPPPRPRRHRRGRSGVRAAAAAAAAAGPTVSAGRRGRAGAGRECGTAGGSGRPPGAGACRGEEAGREAHLLRVGASGSRAAARPAARHAPRRRREDAGRRWERAAGCGVWAAGDARWPHGLGVRVRECVHTCVGASGGPGPARTVLRVRCAREQVECVRAAWAAGPPGTAGWSVGARVFVPACVCAWAPPPPVPRADSCPKGCATVGPWSPPPRSFPEPAPSLPLRPASPLHSDRDPPLGSSKALRGAGGPWRLPSRPIASSRSSSGTRRGWRGGRSHEDAAAASADEPGPAVPVPVPALRCAVRPPLPLCLGAPPRPLSLQLEGGFPTHPPPRPPAFPHSPHLSLGRPSLASPIHAPSFPFPVPTYLLTPWSPRTGAEGRAVE